MNNDKRNKYMREYQKKNNSRFSLCLSKTKDADIIKELDSQDNKQACIKKLIRDGMLYRDLIL